MADLVLGPMLRYVGETDATVWVETDAPCDVDVLGQRARTFAVRGHHYALVVVDGLDPASVVPYEVALDGQVVWPAGESDFPRPVIRTRPRADFCRIVFGSCRAAAPHVPPWTLPRADSSLGLEVDALSTYAHRLRSRDHGDWPDLVLMLGDQVYADAASPKTRAFIRSRRDPSRPPGEEVADFDEYTFLYREAWEDPGIRWLLSTVPVAMIFDDHDIIDDWNISASWLRDMRATDWWDARIVGGFMAYWIYQHLGNLSPGALAGDATYADVLAASDAGKVLADFAYAADRDSRTARWSYERNLGSSRLLVVDSRAGRVLGDDERDMLDEGEWAWIDERITGDHDHLILASSLPWLLAPGIHALESWNEAVCAGAWGWAAANAGEAVRRAIDLEHWAAFRTSFERLAGMVRAAGSGRRGRAPASVLVLSGDVHHAYVAQADWPDVSSVVAQVVASPMRQALEPAVQRAYSLALSRAGEAIGRRLARGARVPDPSFRWRLTAGPWFRNQVATLEMDGRVVRLHIEGVRRGVESGQRPTLETLFEQALTGAANDDER